MGTARLLPVLVALTALAGCARPHASWVRPAARAEVEVRPAPAAGERTAPAELGDGASQWKHGRVHVVKAGETLYKVALLYGVDPDELADSNEITDPRRLGVGRELLLPPEKGRRVASTGPTPPREPAARPGPRRVSADTGPRPTGRIRWPVEGVLTGRFGLREGERHDGIDIAAPEGTPIVAAEDGEVIYAGNQRGYGNIVILRHGSGRITIYAHNQTNTVAKGARVAAGAEVAKVGRSGRATGPHCHFEVREGTRPRDPLLFLRGD